MNYTAYRFTAAELRLLRLALAEQMRYYMFMGMKKRAAACRELKKRLEGSK